FAFGLVLYEMLTGQRAFEGKSAPSVMAAILEKEPTPISALKPKTAPALEQVVQTCLAKDPAERWQSVREMKHALSWASRSGPARSGSGRIWITAIAALAIAGAVSLGLAHRRQRPEKPAPIRFQILLPDKARSEDPELGVSPDGRKVVLQLSLDEVSQ